MICYNENSDKGYILEVDIEHRQNLNFLNSDLPLFSKRMKIKKSCKIFYKVSCNLYDISNHVTHIRNLKRALNHGLIYKSTKSNSI